MRPVRSGDVLELCHRGRAFWYCPKILRSQDSTRTRCLALPGDPGQRQDGAACIRVHGVHGRRQHAKLSQLPEDGYGERAHAVRTANGPVVAVRGDADGFHRRIVLAATRSARGAVGARARGPSPGHGCEASLTGRRAPSGRTGRHIPLEAKDPCGAAPHGRAWEKPPAPRHGSSLRTDDARVLARTANSQRRSVVWDALDASARMCSSLEQCVSGREAAANSGRIALQPNETCTSRHVIRYR